MENLTWYDIKKFLNDPQINGDFLGQQVSILTEEDRTIDTCADLKANRIFIDKKKIKLEAAYE